jgi:plastocyanin
MTRTHQLSIAAALAAVMALAACTPSSGTSTAPATTPGATAADSSAAAASGGVAGSSADVSTTIQVRDFELQPATVSVSGSVLSIAVTNAGPTIHNVTVRDAAGNVLFGTKDLREGEAETVVHAITPGTYVLFCSLPGHESLGVKGTLTVTAP